MHERREKKTVPATSAKKYEPGTSNVREQYPHPAGKKLLGKNLSLQKKDEGFKKKTTPGGSYSLTSCTEKTFAHERDGWFGLHRGRGPLGSRKERGERGGGCQISGRKEKTAFLRTCRGPGDRAVEGAADSKRVQGSRTGASRSAKGRERVRFSFAKCRDGDIRESSKGGPRRFRRTGQSALKMVQSWVRREGREIGGKREKVKITGSGLQGWRRLRPTRTSCWPASCCAKDRKLYAEGGGGGSVVHDQHYPVGVPERRGERGTNRSAANGTGGSSP